MCKNKFRRQINPQGYGFIKIWINTFHLTLAENKKNKKKFASLRKQVMEKPPVRTWHFIHQCWKTSRYHLTKLYFLLILSWGINHIQCQDTYIIIKLHVRDISGKTDGYIGYIGLESWTDRHDLKSFWATWATYC